MDWTEWLHKTIFVQLKSGGHYNGKVVDVDATNEPLIFFSMIDKFGDKVTFVTSEIIKIVEEKA